ncbi:hypothetical protein V1264_013848 [Littorina saxatilis]|uniref:Uncharacterized protein n=2 Tax=Littorina saxatilis TaxID=31220 RepID=A0AAN9BQZ5_9CAEN
MSNGYTFTQFMQAALGPDPRDPRFYQQPPPPPHSGGSSLSALAPAFNPGIPPPNMLPAQGHQNVPQQFYQMNTPSARKHQSSGDARVHFQGSQDFLPQPDMGSEDSGQFQQHPSHRGNFSFHRGGRGRARGQGVHRGRGGFGQGQNQYQYSNRGYHSQSQSQSQNFPNSSGNKPRQQQHSRARERHSKDDNGDLLYSHADLNAAQNSQGGGGNQESNDVRQRNTYVRPVNQYNSRVNGHPHSQNGARNESARGGRRGYRGDHEDRTTPPDCHSDKQGSAAQYKNRNGLRDRATPPDSDKQGSAAQYKNRNGVRSANSSRKKAADDDQPETGDRRAQMEEQLKRGCYECMVCCDNIRQEVAVWNCQKCYHVFHLRCIKQWVKSSLEAEEDIWRCPACQNLNLKPPNGYRCFCGKVKDPKFQPGETPHSCGEVCRRKGKENCTHKCTL